MKDFDPSRAVLEEEHEQQSEPRNPDYLAKGRYVAQPGPALGFNPSRAVLDEDAEQGITGTLKSGAKNTWRAITAAADTYAGDADAVVKASAEQDKQRKDYRLEGFYDDFAKKTGMGTDEEKGIAGSVAGGLSAVAHNPAGAGLAVLEQAPNAVPTLAAGWAGAKLGAAGGAAVGSAVPGIGTAVGGAVGGAAGFVTGMWLGNTVIETGHKAMEHARDGDFDDDEQSQAIREGAIKGGVISAIDAITLGIGGKVSAAFRRTAAASVEQATAKVLTEAGVDVTNRAAVEAAKASPEIARKVADAQKNAARLADNMRKRSAEIGVNLNLEMFGEGLGEYLGELAATGEASVPEAVLEGMMSLGQSGAEAMFNFAKARGEGLTDQEWINAANGIYPEGMGPQEIQQIEQSPPLLAPPAPGQLANEQAGQTEGQTSPLGLPPPVYQVAPDGSIETSADVNARLDRIRRGEVLDRTPVPEAPKPSEQLGLDPNAGAMSAAAAMAVDSGASAIAVAPQPLVGEFLPSPAGLGFNPQRKTSEYTADAYGNISEVDGQQMPGYAQGQPRIGREYGYNYQQPVYEVGPDGEVRQQQGQTEQAQSMRTRVDMSGVKGPLQDTGRADRGQVKPAASRQQVTPAEQAGGAWNTMSTAERAVAAEAAGMRGVPLKNITGKSWESMSDKQREALTAPVNAQQGSRWTDPNRRATDQAGPVLQPRDRSSEASIAQMRNIASAPDYAKASYSRTFTDGAPVTIDEIPNLPAAQRGRQESVTTASDRRIPIQYAVVEASQLLPSNNISGASNAEYSAGGQGKSRAIAGNGRVAGLTEAWRRGTAGQYKADMMADDLHGIDPQVIAGMKQPVLVRLMPQNEVTDDIGDLSNRDSKLDASAVEQAKADGRAVDLANLKYNSEGGIGGDTARDFVSKLPGATNLVSGGKVTQRGIDRLTAAIFQKAYNNDALTELLTERGEGARSIINAMAQAAPHMAKLEGAGAFDIRGLVAQAGEVALTASRSKESLASVIQQTDMGVDPHVYPILEMMVNERGNIRSAKYIAEQLINLANLAHYEATQDSSDMFGERPKRTTQQLIDDAFSGVKGNVERTAGQAEQVDGDQSGSQDDLGQQGRPEPDAQVAERPESGRERPADAGQPAPAQQQAEVERPKNWRANYLSAAKVARGLGIDPREHRKLPELLAAIDAYDQQGQSQSIEQLQEQVRQSAEADPFSDEHIQNQGRLLQLMREDAEAELAAGRPVVYKGAGSNPVHYTITPSAKEAGKYQVTQYNDTGALSDTQHDTVADAMQEHGAALAYGARKVEGEQASALMMELMQAESAYRDQQQEQDFNLQAQTEEQLAQQEAETKAAAEAEAKAKRKADEAERKRKEQEADKARADEVADSFELGQSADEAMSGMGDIFDQQPTSEQIDAAASEANTNPTEAQKEAGNYKKGSINLHGLDIAIENPRGSERSGIDPDGKEWRHTMSDHYGYIRRTNGADGDQVDVFIGKNPESDRVFIVDQINQGTGSFDEHKIMLGFSTQEEAIKAYKANYDRGWKVGPVQEMDVSGLKEWLKNGDTTKPAAEATSIEDFGEKMSGTRKEQAQSMVSRVDAMSDDDIAASPLSKIWPKNEVDKIEDTFQAAAHHVIRAAIPNKPRVKHRLKAWVERVKAAKELSKELAELGEGVTIAEMRKRMTLGPIADHIELLTNIDRKHWGRIDSVGIYQGRYQKDGEMVPGSWVQVKMDSRTRLFYGHDSVASALQEIKSAIEGTTPQQLKMKFAIYTYRNSGHAYITYDGDKEKRKLKEFPSTKEARLYLHDNYESLVEAWDAVKLRDNVTRKDMRQAENSDRVGPDYRNGKDVTPEAFLQTFGFRGVDFGKWVAQGRGRKERQGLLNDAHDALMDLAGVLNLPPKALSLNGELGIGFGSRGKGGFAAAHYEPGNIVINLTKTQGAGSLAHEWFHALDHYFARQRTAPVDSKDRQSAYITFRPEPMYIVNPEKVTQRWGVQLTQAELKRRHENALKAGSTSEAKFYDPANWMPDPNHPDGVRPVVERAFAEVVEALDKSPMTQRAMIIDQGKSDGYWSRIIERGARAFETYVIAKLADKGSRNDYLANVVSFERFARNPDRYPYLTTDEQGSVNKAFDKLFDTIETRDGEDGNVVLFSFAGEKSGTAMHAELAKAKRLAARGVGNEDVRQATGWHRGADGKWRYEISDHEAKLAVSGSTMGEVVDLATMNALADGRSEATIGDVMDHPALFRAYPELAKIKVRKMDGPSRTAIASVRAVGNTFTISLNPRAKGNYALSALIHELQHAIQTIEGFARGGNSRMAARLSNLSLSDKAAANAYMRLYGEVEARNTQARMQMNEEFRKLFPPSETQDVSDADAIVTFNGSEVQDFAAADAITEAQLRNVFAARFPKLVKALDGMLAKGDRRESGGLIILSTADPLKIAGQFSKATGRDLNESIRLFSNAEDAQGFFDPRSGLTFLVGPSVNETNAAAVVLHEAIHGQQNKRLDQAAVQMLVNRKKEKNADTRAFLDRVVRRMAQAEGGVTELEAAAYIVEQAIMEGRDGTAGQLVDSGLIGWIEQNIGKAVADMVRDFVKAYRQFALRHGLGVRVTIDDMIQYAQASMRQSARSGAQGGTTSKPAGQQAQTDTAAFKRWFGDSKIVDRSGKPAVMYHGTMSDFGVFTSAPQSNGLIYVTESADVASRYATEGGGWTTMGMAENRANIKAFLEEFPNPSDKDFEAYTGELPYGVTSVATLRDFQETISEGGNVMPLYVRAERPMGSKESPIEWREAERMGAKGIRSKGFDSVWVTEGDGVALAVLGSNQLKSVTGNKGTYDLANPDIGFSRTGENIDKQVMEKAKDAALQEALRAMHELNGYDIDEEIQRLEESGDVDMSEIFENPEYWDSEDEALTDAGVEKTHEIYKRQALENLGLPDIATFEDIKDAHQFAQHSAAMEFFDKLGINYDSSRVGSTSRYLVVHGENGSELKLRFADHAKTTSNSLHAKPDVNVAPGADLFTDAISAALRFTGSTGAFSAESGDIRFSRKASAKSQPATNGPEVLVGPLASRFDDIVYKLQDKHIDLKRVIQEIRKTTGGITDALDTYLQETLFHGRAAKRTQDFVRHELGDLTRAMQQGGISKDALEEYLHARHAQEANEVLAERNPNQAMIDAGLARANATITRVQEALDTDPRNKDLRRELKDAQLEAKKWRTAKPFKGTEAERNSLSGMSNAEAQAVLSSLNPIQQKHMDKAASLVDAIIDKTRQEMVEYGLESQDTVDEWAAQWQHYIPLMREQLEDETGGMHGIGQGYSVRGREAKGRTGSTKQVVDILANIAMQREKVIVRGEKNRVALSLVGLAREYDMPGFWKVDTVPTVREIDPATGLVRNHPDPTYRSKPNAVVAKVNGKEVAVLFDEDNPRAMRAATAMKNLDAAQLEGLMGAVATATRYFAAVNTQYNPIFGVTNFVRDLQHAMLALSSTPLQGKQSEIASNTLRAIKHIYKAERGARKGSAADTELGRLWDEFQSVGGQTGYRDQYAHAADRGKAIEKALNPDAWADSKLGRLITADGRLKAPLSVVRKAGGWLFDLLSDYNTAMENGVRLSAYKAGLDAGMTKERAAELAKNLTVNFNRKGAATQQIGSLYAFFNAAVQGTTRIGETLFEMEPGKPNTARLSKAGKAIVGGGVLMGSIQALLLAAAGFDDDEPPEFIRERNIIIPTGGKTYISIPMPLGYHVITNLGRIPMEFALGGGEDLAKHMGSLLDVMADIYNPLGGAGMSLQSIAPTVIDPFAALAENKDFGGRAIAKQSFDKTTPGHQLARDNASLPATWLAQAINYVTGGTEFTRGELSPTPDQIDYLVGQITGGVGRELTKVGKTGQMAAQGDEWLWHNVPLLGRFIGDAGNSTAKQSAYYNALNDVNRHAAEIKGLRNSGRYEEASRYLSKHPEAGMQTIARATDKQIKNLRDMARDLTEQGASRAEVRAVEQQMISIMERFSQQMEARR